ncbi:MAG: DUF1801 domain-containing protein [Flavobacteriales bacterium]|jgi:hypothetical protein|nr:DUF1801 domain-containing protein [Flavobacteriales bacterium]
MAKAELKTRETDASVDDFIAAQPKDEVRSDCRALIALMSELTGAPPKMWGAAIVGFGSVPLTYASGRQLDWPLLAFSPRKTALTLYLTCDIQQYAGQLARLGKHSTGKGCLYIKRLADVDMGVLRGLLLAGLDEVGATDRG